MFLLVLLALPLCDSKITVYSPPALRTEMQSRHSDGVIPSTLAPFGNPPYGSRMIGKVYLPAHRNETRACNALSPLELEAEDMTAGEGTVAPIVLVNRGDCPFARKVRNAQDIGARAVLIVDDQSDESELDKALLFDDGSNGDIVIPSFLITKAEGHTIRKHAKTEEVVLILTFEISEHHMEAVDITLWMSSGSNQTMKFVSEFAEKALEFPQGTLHFSPHYVLWYCTGCKLTDFKAEAPNCLSGGRYCSPDPDGSGPLDGRMVVYEDLRQICINQLTSDHGPNDWFSYVSTMYSLCVTERLKKDCSLAAMKGIISADKVSKCVAGSFVEVNGTVMETVNDNTLLAKEKGLWVKHGPSFFPSVQINNVTLKGEINAEQVIRAVCDAFSTPPPNCIKIEPKVSANTVSFLHMVLTILLILGLLSGVLIVYRLWMRRELQGEMKKQVNVAVSQYVSLNDDRKRRNP